MSTPAANPEAPDLTEEIRATVQGQTHQREFQIIHEETRSIDETARTVELSFSSETPYERYWGTEVLGHKKGEVRLERLIAAGCVLIDHRGDQVGAIDSVKLVKGQGRAVLRFSRSVRGQEVFQDVVDGIRKSVSVGYRIHEMKLISKSGEQNTYRVTDWEPHEVSLVGIPADVTVGVGRSAQPATPPEPAPEAPAPVAKSADLPSPQPAASAEPTPQTRNITMSEQAPAGIDPAEAQRQLDAATSSASARAAEIATLGQKYGCMDLALKSINDANVGVAEFKGLILENQGRATQVKADPKIGMDDKEVREYSVAKAIREMASGRGLTGLEKEAHAAVEKNTRRESRGFFIPFDVQAARSLSSGVASAGGHTVGTEVLGGSMVELLRNKMRIMQLGAQMLSGLSGDLAIPKATGGATAYWLDEGEDTTPTDQTFGQIGLKPKRVAAQTAFTKQFLAQSSIDVESFIRNDLMSVLALAKDLACINGAGGKEPIGILNATGINTVTFGAAPTWAKVIAFETAVEEDNALINTLAYLTTPGVKGAWKGTEKASGTAQFLWANNEVNGYPAVATNQVPSNKVICGDFSQLVVADWAGIDVTVNPYSLDTSGKIRVTIQMLTDVAVRHAQSFCVSTDAGNQ